MTRVNDLHQKAMSLVDEAQFARLAGSEERYLELSTSAFAYESEAAWALVGDLELEPSRSVIFRSAAALALDIKNFREAERLISAALAGNPPDEIADELRDLLEDVYFARHLEVRGVKLSSAELQMTLDGDAVGFGIARSESFVQRLRDFEKLIYRTAERRMGEPFRERGARWKPVASQCRPRCGTSSTRSEATAAVANGFQSGSKNHDLPLTVVFVAIRTNA